MHPLLNISNRNQATNFLKGCTSYLHSQKFQPLLRSCNIDTNTFLNHSQKNKGHFSPGAHKSAANIIVHHPFLSPPSHFVFLQGNMIILFSFSGIKIIFTLWYLLSRCPGQKWRAYNYKSILQKKVHSVNLLWYFQAEITFAVKKAPCASTSSVLLSVLIW